MSDWEDLEQKRVELEMREVKLVERLAELDGLERVLRKGNETVAESLKLNKKYESELLRLNEFLSSREKTLNEREASLRGREEAASQLLDKIEGMLSKLTAKGVARG